MSEACLSLRGTIRAWNDLILLRNIRITSVHVIPVIFYRTYAVNPPVHSICGIIGSPVDGSTGGRMLKTERILAIINHAFASARKRPGQILAKIICQYISYWLILYVACLRPKPKTKVAGSWGPKLFSLCTCLFVFVSTSTRKRSGLKVSGSGKYCSSCAIDLFGMTMRTAINRYTWSYAPYIWDDYRTSWYHLALVDILV